MRAAVMKQFGQVPVVEEFDEPHVAPEEAAALIQVRYGALNPLDLKIASGTFYGTRPDLPYVVGNEGMGVVRSSETLRAGTRVYFGAARPGAVAELVVARDDSLVEVPDALEDAVASGLGVAGVAAWESLRLAGLQAGERVLVLGATGAVGSIAVQVAKIMGAARVVAAGRDRAGLARLCAHRDVSGDMTNAAGADACVALEDDDPSVIARRIVEAARGEVDVIVDPLWGKPALAALIAAAPGARLVNLGDSAGEHIELPSALVRSRSLRVLGYTNFRLTPSEQRSALENLFLNAVQGRLFLDHEVLAIQDIAKAWERQADSPHVKLVVEIS